MRDDPESDHDRAAASAVAWSVRTTARMRPAAPGMKSYEMVTGRSDLRSLTTASRILTRCRSRRKRRSPDSGVPRPDRQRAPPDGSG
jgi:hypothetical protein